MTLVNKKTGKVRRMGRGIVSDNKKGVELSIGDYAVLMSPQEAAGIAAEINHRAQRHMIEELVKPSGSSDK